MHRCTQFAAKSAHTLCCSLQDLMTLFSKQFNVPACGWDAPSFDVLIHPNRCAKCCGLLWISSLFVFCSGCEYEDHGKWHFWVSA